MYVHVCTHTDIRSICTYVCTYTYTNFRNWFNHHLVTGVVYAYKNVHMYVCECVHVQSNLFITMLHELHQNFMVTVFVLVVHTVEPLLKALPIKDTI